MTFDVLWRNGSGDHPIATWTHHFDPPPSGFNATQYEEDAAGVAAAAKSGDQLILRLSAQSASTTASIVFIPNSDGANAMGRIPSLTLPK